MNNATVLFGMSQIQILSITMLETRTERLIREVLPSECVSGQYYSQEDKDCIFCPVGHRELEGVCLECEPGKAAESVGQTECVRCNPGQIAETSGMSVCEDCAVGKHTTGIQRVANRVFLRICGS